MAKHEKEMAFSVIIILVLPVLLLSVCGPAKLAEGFSEAKADC